MRDIKAMKINRYDVPVHPLDYDKPNMMFGQWCRAIDVERLEALNAELLQALELAERKLLRLHISLSLNEKAGRRSADADPDVQKIRAAINKAKGDHQ